MKGVHKSHRVQKGGGGGAVAVGFLSVGWWQLETV